ncbi:SnoaL-like polyketide cyclase [Aliiruegeria haliotis]|uniref:SnoaL-like polyketide cyclase n=1 Tax=Aliiruegeria haliotis TaxID=1280846 RepID=A0A2T0RZM7_9RHOB|nr:ester cyclase [Aliiruegeria haliotis]PRY26503.1 SnoaL-like polyketide cyclase [Aliiruegeria haliotis]
MSPQLKLLQDFYNRVWVDGDMAAAGEFFMPEAEATGLLSDLAVGAEEFHEFVAALLEMLDVHSVNFQKAVEQDDWISAMASFDATVLTTGQSISGSGMVMVRIRDGKIVEAYNCFDFLSFLEKLGLVPEHALALCMTGQRLT